MRRLFGWVMVCAGLLPAAASGKTVDVASSAAPPQSSASVSKASAAIDADSARLLRLFHQLHSRPGRGLSAMSRGATVAAELAVNGFGVHLEGLEGTRVVATLRNGEGPTLVYRASAGTDVEEAGHAAQRAGPNGGAHERTSQGERDRAGDANLTWMLGMAKALSTLRADWAGTLVLVSEATAHDDEFAASGRAEVTLELPAPDMVLALSASSAPFGSILGVRGRRRPGTDAVDVSVHRFGVYEGIPHHDSGRQLAAATVRRFGVPDDAMFGYVLVGIADQRQITDAPSVLETVPFGEGEAVPIDLAAIPLGAKVATVAVLELLARAKPRPGDARGQWTLHQY